MRKITILSFLFSFLFVVQAQNQFQLNLKDLITNEPIANATIAILDSALQLNAITDSNGIAQLKNVPDGKWELSVSSLGYFRKKVKILVPFKKQNEAEMSILLEPKFSEIEEVVIVTTRTKVNMDQLPTRVEVVSEDAVNERSLDKPADISHALKEQTGIQMQRTSANSGYANFRMLGLKGKYVQLLRDGFPIFSGLNQSMAFSQISPMDVKQIEMIKGPSSTLYGGDAISGVINIISKEPDQNTERNILLNGESSRSADAGIYWREKFNWFGITLNGQFRSQQAKDWNRDSFSDMPKLNRYAISPQLFFYVNKNLKIQFGTNYLYETRAGGAMSAIAGKVDSNYLYLEKNTSSKLGYNFKLEQNFDKKGSLVVKSSLVYFKRNLSIYNYQFQGKQFASQHEINYQIRVKKHEITTGVNFKSDNFTDLSKDSLANLHNHQFYTVGLILQDVYVPNNKTSLSAGIRLDYNQKMGAFVLPQAAWLQKWNEVFSSRMNFGMGYKLPTIFQDESEENHFKNVLPLSANLKPEMAYGGTLSVSAKSPKDKVFKFSVDEMFFINQLVKPIQATVKDMGTFQTVSYQNANGYYQAIGLETTLKLGYRGFGFQFGYTLQDQQRKVNNIKSMAPLTSKHIISLLAGYEIQNKFSFGIDAYYYSPQLYSTGGTTKSIWELGANFQVITKYFTVFTNFENILNIRQTSYGATVFANPTFNTPKFAEIYGPLDGRVLNVGIKIKLGSLGAKKAE